MPDLSILKLQQASKSTYDSCPGKFNAENQQMSWFLTNLAAALLLPPLSLLLIALAGLLLWRKRPRIARAMLAGSFTLLWLLSTPFLSGYLLQSLESTPLTLADNTVQADAVVVLGGGTYIDAPEYAGDTVGPITLQRIRYTAKLNYVIKKPVLLTGGRPLGNSLSEAFLMRQVMQDEFHSPVQWIEEESNNTLENALYSYRLLHAAGINRIYLVTHAWHMPRALYAFRKAGFEVIPAPTAFTTRYQLNLLAFLPNAGSLQSSQLFMHEVIGLFWYRLKS